MKKKVLMLLLLGAFFLAGGAQAQAGIYAVFFDVFTTNFSDITKQRVDFVVKIFESTGLRGPNAVTSIKVKAPNGKIVDITNSWDEWDDQFHANVKAVDLGGVTPGLYTVTVLDKSVPAKSFPATDTLATAAFLPVSTVNAKAIPTLSWTAAAGAQFYRVQLLEVKEGVTVPVYYQPKNVLINKTSFIIPEGVLKPATTYTVRIEARDNDKNPNRRSHSNWVQFTTP